MTMAQSRPLFPPDNPPQSGVQLDLSMDEAYTLAAILDRIGGDPKTSARRHADAMRRALNKANIHATDAPKGIMVQRLTRDTDSGLFFVNNCNCDCHK